MNSWTWIFTTSWSVDIADVSLIFLAGVLVTMGLFQRYK